MDWADRTEGRGNAGGTASSFFHPSGPSEFGYLIQHKSLILQAKLARGAGQTPFHPVNPGKIGLAFMPPWFLGIRPRCGRRACDQPRVCRRDNSTDNREDCPPCDEGLPCSEQNRRLPPDRLRRPASK